MEEDINHYYYSQRDDATKNVGGLPKSVRINVEVNYFDSEKSVWDTDDKTR